MVTVDRIKLFEKAVQSHPHLKEYLEKWVSEGNKLPEFYVQLQSDMAKLKEFNYIYPVLDPMFIHVFKTGVSGKHYVTIEPSMAEETHGKYEDVLSAILKEAPYEKSHETKAEFTEVLDKLMRKVTTDKKATQDSWLSRKMSGFEAKKILVNSREFEEM